MEKRIPPFVNKRAAGAYGKEIGILALEGYVKKIWSKFSVTGLPPEQQTDCKQLQKELAKELRLTIE